MFTFRGVTEDAERLKQRIRNVLGCRHAMHIGELRIRLGVDNITVRKELEALMARGEIEPPAPDQL